MNSHESVVSGFITAGVSSPVVGSNWLLWEDTIDEVSIGREDATPHGFAGQSCPWGCHSVHRLDVVGRGSVCGAVMAGYLYKSCSDCGIVGNQIMGSPIDQVGPVCGPTSEHSCEPCETLPSPFITSHSFTLPLGSCATYCTRFFLVIDQLWEPNCSPGYDFSQKRTYIPLNQLMGGH